MTPKHFELSHRRWIGSVAGLGVLAAGVQMLAGCRASAPPPAEVGPRRIGNLTTGLVKQAHPVLLERLSELGWVEGTTLAVEFRSSDGSADRLPELADDLVRSNVEVIVAPTSLVARALRAATSDIPIVTVLAGDPVAEGLVTSLARPGGNVTGLSRLSSGIAGKRLELLKQVRPSISRVAVLRDPNDPETARDLADIQAAAPVAGIRIHVAEARDPDEVRRQFEAGLLTDAEGLLVLGGSLTQYCICTIVPWVNTERMLAVYESRSIVTGGGLMSYGARERDLFRRGAEYVDRILRGARPADMPVEQATVFELVINLKTAESIGLTIPPSVLAQATEVIQ
jgi:putative ABC transport system substrate-binding protein